jgi:hypothetical protein
MTYIPLAAVFLFRMMAYSNKNFAGAPWRAGALRTEKGLLTIVLDDEFPNVALRCEAVWDCGEERVLLGRQARCSYPRREEHLYISKGIVCIWS